MIHLAEDIAQWRAVVNTEMNFWIKKNTVNILSSWRKYGIEDLSHLVCCAFFSGK